MKFGSYKARRNDKGHLVIENVPIFVECTRGETHFSVEWIESAVRKAKQAEREGYLPPLHIRHHEAGTPVEPAGYFRIRGAGPITFKGKTRTAIFADLVVTRPWVEEDVLAARLPYRSVEIFDVDEPAINSLALLDHEPPYLELPMLMVDEPAREIGRPAPEPLVRVADATFANPWQSTSYQPGEPVVACFRRGHSAHLFLEDADSMKTKTKNEAPKPGAQFACDEPEETMADDEVKDDGEAMADEPDPEGGEKMAEGGDGDGGDGEESGEDETGDGFDIDAICQAIEAGAISVAAMERLKASMVKQQNTLGAAVEQQAPPPGQAPAPAPTPGQAMKNTPQKTAQFAAMQAKIDAQDAKITAMEHAAARKLAVDEALARLEGRPLGADPATKFAKRFDELGAEGFKLYIDDLAALAGRLPSSAAGKAAAFAAQTSNAPESALAYTEQGTEAVEKAATFAAEYGELRRRNMTRHSEEAYVQSNMLRAGFKAPTKAAK